MNELKFNVVQSIGEITANFDEFKNQVSQELEKYKSKEFTEDTKKDVKKDLAELRKKKAAVNERRIEVKKEYMKPYDEFEAKVKELITLIDEPITLIDYKVKEFEEKELMLDSTTVENLMAHVRLKCLRAISKKCLKE